MRGCDAAADEAVGVAFSGVLLTRLSAYRRAGVVQASTPPRTSHVARDAATIAPSGYEAASAFTFGPPFSERHQWHEVARMRLDEWIPRPPASPSSRIRVVRRDSPRRCVRRSLRCAGGGLPPGEISLAHVALTAEDLKNHGRTCTDQLSLTRMTLLRSTLWRGVRRCPLKRSMAATLSRLKQPPSGQRSAPTTTRSP